MHISYVGTILFLSILCYVAVLKVLAYYAQYYAQGQGLCSAYYIQVGINNSLHITEFKKDCYIREYFEWYQIALLFYNDCSIRIYR